MLSATISIFGLALAGLSSAQTSTISLYIPGADTQPLVGSVIGSDSAATTFALQCAPGTDATDCGFPGVFTLTEGPATAAYTFLAETGIDGTIAFTGYFDCSLAGTTSAVCAESFGGTEANDPGSSTETFSGSDFTYMPVTITGSAAVSSSSSSVAKGGPTPHSTGSTSTGTSKSTSVSGTGGTTSSPKSTGTGTGTGAGAVSQSSSSSTGGMPAITGNAKWVLGGGAAVAMAVLA